MGEILTFLDPQAQKFRAVHLLQSSVVKPPPVSLKAKSHRENTHVGVAPGELNSNWDIPDYRNPAVNISFIQERNTTHVCNPST